MEWLLFFVVVFLFCICVVPELGDSVMGRTLEEYERHLDDLD